MQNEGSGLERKGADIEERLLDFAVRVGKAIDALPDTRLERHIAGQPEQRLEQLRDECDQLCKTIAKSLVTAESNQPRTESE